MKLRGSSEKRCLPSTPVSTQNDQFSEKQGRVQLNDFLKVMDSVGMLLKEPEQHAVIAKLFADKKDSTVAF